LNFSNQTQHTEIINFPYFIPEYKLPHCSKNENDAQEKSLDIRV